MTDLRQTVVLLPIEAMPAESDSRSLAGCMYLTAETEIEFLETRMLNPPEGLYPLQAGDPGAAGYQRAPLGLLHRRGRGGRVPD